MVLMACLRFCLRSYSGSLGRGVIHCLHPADVSRSRTTKKWKAAIITPVFKKGSAGTVANYRPISLTCVPCKIIERLISSRMLQFFLDNNILHPAQHGFLKGIGLPAQT